MARTPSYPKDAPVESAAARDRSDPPAHIPTSAKAADAMRNKHLMTGAAIGIGSAAIVAALLYAKSGKKVGP